MRNKENKLKSIQARIHVLIDAWQVKESCKKQVIYRRSKSTRMIHLTTICGIDEPAPNTSRQKTIASRSSELGHDGKHSHPTRYAVPFPPHDSF